MFYKKCLKKCLKKFILLQKIERFPAMELQHFGLLQQLVNFGFCNLNTVIFEIFLLIKIFTALKSLSILQNINKKYIYIHLPLFRLYNFRL